MENNDQLAKLKHLVTLFAKRDQLYQRATEDIVQVVGPTTLKALVTMFNVPFENVTWIELQVVEELLVIVASIVYEEDQQPPAVIQALSPMPDTMEPSIRLFRVAVPLEVVFQPAEEILQYFKKTAEEAAAKAQAQSETVVSDDAVPVTTQQFNLKELTPEQIKQLILFSGNQTGTKH